MPFTLGLAVIPAKAGIQFHGQPAVRKVNSIAPRPRSGLGFFLEVPLRGTYGRSAAGLALRPSPSPGLTNDNGTIGSPLPRVDRYAVREG